MKNCESRKTPCQSCKGIRKTLSTGMTFWCGGCGTWTVDSAGRFIRPLARMN
jgi:hypothetical protein